MILPCRHCHHVACDTHRPVCAGRAPVAKLSVIRLPHGPERAIAVNKQGVTLSHGCRHPTRHYTDWGGLVVGVPIAELAHGVVAPGLHRGGAEADYCRLADGDAGTAAHHHMVTAAIRDLEGVEVNARSRPPREHHAILHPLVAEIRHPAGRHAQAGGFPLDCHLAGGLLVNARDDIQRGTDTVRSARPGGVASVGPRV